MQTLNNELLNAVPFDAATLRAILESNRDFVLEPLDDDDDDNDIDDGNDNAVRRRDERVRTHLQTLEERIPIAKNNQVRQVLVAMRDFVSEHYQQ